MCEWGQASECGVQRRSWRQLVWKRLRRNPLRGASQGERGGDTSGLGYRTCRWCIRGARNHDFRYTTMTNVMDFVNGVHSAGFAIGRS
jgi:hypothetical protein